jgi:hypothetical protein
MARLMRHVNEEAVSLVHFQDKLAGMVFKKNRLCGNVTQPETGR